MGGSKGGGGGEEAEGGSMELAHVGSLVESWLPTQIVSACLPASPLPLYWGGGEGRGGRASKQADPVLVANQLLRATGSHCP